MVDRSKLFELLKENPKADRPPPAHVVTMRELVKKAKRMHAAGHPPGAIAHFTGLEREVVDTIIRGH